MSGWGGSRVGAGRKPTKRKDKPEPFRPFAIVPPSQPSPAPHAADDCSTDQCSTDQPSDLPADQRAFWALHAPLAVERGTLTDATVPAFRLLCELEAKKAMVGTMVDKGALGGLRVFLQLSKQVEGLMARFCLAPFGKPVKGEKPKVASNPWSDFGRAMKK